MNDTAYSADNKISSEPKSDKMRQPKRLPISIWVSASIFALVPVARWYLFDTDHQLANLVGIGISLIGCLVAYVGCWQLFAKSAARKFFFLAMPVVFIALGLSFFEFVGFTGETLPVFRTKPWLKRPSNDTTNVIKSDGLVRRSTGTQESIASSFSSLQFLGSDRNGVIRNEEFSVAWGDKLPTVLWKIPIGAGWSSFAVSNGLAITLEQIDDQESLTAFELTTGKVVWRHKSPGRHMQAFGGLGPRATPTIHRTKVFSQTALGIVSCVELETGKLVWEQDLLKLAGINQETSEKSISWGRSGSPLVFDGQVVVPFGGKTNNGTTRSLISFDLETGKEIWSGGDQQIAYSSPVLLNLCGVRQIVSINEGSATGHNSRNGLVLWSTPWPSKSNGDACSSQPVAVDSRRLLLGKGYALGSKLIELSYSGTSESNESDPTFWKVDTVWSNTRILKTKFTSATAFDGLLYGLSDGILECVDPRDGSRVWRGKRYGHGQSMIVNGHLLITTEDGRVVLIPATASDQGHEIAQLPVLEGVTWNVPAVAGPFLLIRNAEFAACIVSKKDAGHDAGSLSQ